MEVEGAAYFSLQKIYAARMILFGMVDSAMLSIFVAISTITVQITIMDILIQFLLPLNVTCCICFHTLCSKKDRSVFSSLSLCLTWLAIWMFLVLRDGIYENISKPIWMGVVVFSVIYLCYSVIQVWRRCEDYYESSGAVS